MWLQPFPTLQPHLKHLPLASRSSCSTYAVTPAKLTPATGLLHMLFLLLGMILPPLFDYIINFCLSFNSHLKQFFKELFLTVMPFSVFYNMHLSLGALSRVIILHLCVHLAGIVYKQKVP